MLSANAAKILEWSRKHASTSSFRTIDGKQCPTLNIHWHAMAKAIGFADDWQEGATRATLAAMDELRRAGFLAWYNEGPNCYGHTTTCLVE